MARGPRTINITNVLLTIALSAGVYFSIIYYPIFKTRTALGDLVKESTYVAKRSQVHVVRAGLIEAAESQLGLVIDPDDVSVETLTTFVKVTVVWRPQVLFVGNYRYQHAFKIERVTALFE